MSIQRYKFATPATEKEVSNQLPPGITATIAGLSPQPFFDWNLSNDAGLDDLTEFMQTRGLEYVGQSPTDPRPVLATEWQPSILSAALDTPPGTPTDGDRYIVAAGGTGAWAGHDDEIAQWRASPAAWLFTVPFIGMAAFDQNSKNLLCHDGTGWSALPPDAKSIFVAATDYDDVIGDYRAFSQPASGDRNYTFKVPDDFDSLIDVSAIGIPDDVVAGGNIVLDSDYAQVTEAFNTHSENDTLDPTTIYTAANVITALPLTSVFSALSAGDLCGIEIAQNGLAVSVYQLGILLRYNTT